MKFKLIIVMAADERSETIVEKAREMGATGATVIKSARGEGLTPAKTFLGLTFEGQVDVILFIVEQHMARSILEGIADAGQFGDVSGAGVAFQVDIEDVVGMGEQLKAIKDEIEDQI